MSETPFRRRNDCVDSTFGVWMWKHLRKQGRRCFTGKWHDVFGLRRYAAGKWQVGGRGGPAAFALLSVEK